MARSAPKLMAFRSVSWTTSGPSEITTTSLAAGSALFFLVPEPRFNGVAVEVADVEFQAGFVDGGAIRGDFEAQVHVGDALDQDGDFHRAKLAVGTVGEKRLCREPEAVIPSSPCLPPIPLQNAPSP